MPNWNDGPGGCACELGDLEPCGEMQPECRPGDKVPCPGPNDENGGCDLGCPPWPAGWHIAERKGA